ncbi:tol-pal system protein YbgF [Methylophilaceae bacterium]|jgi:tol-pal system protein YbgF|nr:tol-pal system protein YbgF [Methylophilaceae bacterium]|tara:strand:+ start:690 stop:1526 length:837 start_codon:yes stop_codon:yes gene_type:complete
MKKYLLVGLVLFSNYVFALFEDEEARKKINDMQDQLNNIEKSLEFKINQKFSKNLSKYSSELNELHDIISKLIGDVEVLQFELKNSKERHKVLYQELNDRILKLESSAKNKNIPQDKLNEVLEKIPQGEMKLKSEEVLEQNVDLVPLVDKNIELDEYAEADLLVKATRYKEAFEAFDKFIVTYPNSDLLPKAKYSLGYSQWALKNYNAAIKTYSKIIQLHTNSEIIPDVIYGIANCEIQLTRITKAKKTLRNLISKYPQAEIIEKAKKRLKALESINL